MATCSRVNDSMLHRAAWPGCSPTTRPRTAGRWAVTEAVAEHWFAAGELERALPASVAAGDAARRCSP